MFDPVDAYNSLPLIMSRKITELSVELLKRYSVEDASSLMDYMINFLDSHREIWR